MPDGDEDGRDASFLAGIRDDAWLRDGRVPEVEYEDDGLRREIEGKRPHERRTAERLARAGIRPRFVRDVRRVKDPVTRQTWNVGLPDLQGGLELKWLNPREATLGSVDGILRKASRKEGLVACVVDNADARLPDEDLAREIRERMGKRGVGRVILIGSDGDIRLIEGSRGVPRAREGR